MVDGRGGIDIHAVVPPVGKLGGPGFAIDTVTTQHQPMAGILAEEVPISEKLATRHRVQVKVD